MEPEAAWRSSKMRAWLVGLVLGMIGAVVSSGVGFFAGLCCLLQFANVLAPLVAGLLGGLGAALVGKWSDMPGTGGAGAGAFLGLRGGGLAAILTGLLGFAFALLLPVLGAAVQAGSGGDLVQSLITALGALAMSGLFAALFAGGGTLAGILLGVAAGAVIGAVRAR